ncbi:cytochrome c-type biogenesis protein [Pseudorhodoplanes sinuspersici]|uniref:Cytochrome c-type biogenesis protein n=1 Tax=Pseudorhodoplanes sinuspersici TaxID=1235591 RepID=A0A1W6ZUA5_9HYPH|nr:cytochrome c-type biogenesis protein [Pseudorhodoplanes sinuspersici]ARQ00974.1 cytochrome c-type biogenesis protein CcmH [Pseudorhodoplanes sinuspersici]RKE72610.1 cytochrome c-type biogenesis protein CcmH [Pseudorhodoplanes sinuspersici]
MQLLRFVAVIVALALLYAAPSSAVQPDEILPDAALEQRARHLSRELRCMVCQNQSIDDSDAPLARDLRLLVRERLKAGDSDQQVLDFLTARYGDFVLLNPPLNWRTALLWALPTGLLVFGGLVLLMMARRQRGRPLATDSSGHQAPLTPEEEARITTLLNKDPRTKA